MALKPSQRSIVGGLLLLVLGGCGGTTTQPPPPGPPPPPPPPPPAPAPIFSTPIAGNPNQVVWYGAYVDEGNRDYQCSFKWYAGHQGVDILLKDFSVQDSGVAVLAAAPGRAVSVRDGLFDRSTENGAGGLGNSLGIDHGPMGPISFYGHLRAGSIRVTQNQAVVRGDTLGLVGSSGNSNWPHLHFEVRTVAGELVDPFIGPCNPPVSQATWLNQLAYQGDFHLMDVGISNKALSFPELLERPPNVGTITPADAAVTFWVNLHNVQAASTRTELRDPAGAVLAQAQTGNVTTFSVRFVTATFGVGSLEVAGEHTLVWYMTPIIGGGEREEARVTFTYDPAAVPAPGQPALKDPGPFPRTWVSPEAGDGRPPRD